MRTLDEAEKLRLAKLSIFDKINKGDWYQYSKEVELQKIVKNSSQKFLKLMIRQKKILMKQENSWRIFFQIYLKVQKYIFQ